MFEELAFFFFFACTRACDPVYLEMKAIPDFKYLNVQLDPQVSSFCVIWYMRKKRKVLFSSQGLIRFEDSLWCLIHECAGLNLWSIYKVCVQSQLRFCSKGKILSMFCRETCLQQKPLNMLLFYAKPILCLLTCYVQNKYQHMILSKLTDMEFFRDKQNKSLLMFFLQQILFFLKLYFILIPASDIQA